MQETGVDPATNLETIGFLLVLLVFFFGLVALTKEVASRFIQWLERHGLLEWLGGFAFLLFLAAIGGS